MNKSVSLKDIEKELNTAKSKGNVSKYFEFLGDAVVMLSKKIIELEAIVEGTQENINSVSLTAKEKLRIQNVRMSNEQLRNELDELKKKVNSL